MGLLDVTVDSSESLQAVATLVKMRIGQYRPNRRSDKAARDAEQANKAKPGAVKAFSNVLAGADGNFRKLRRVANAADRYNRTHTLQYANMGDGWRMLSNSSIFTYGARAGEYRDTLATLKQELEPKLEQDLAEARRNLGDLAEERALPTAAEIVNAFRIEIDFMPMPSEAGFNFLPEGFGEHLARHLTKQSEERFRAALKSGWNEVAGYIQHMQETLVDPQKNGFKSTLVTNIETSLHVVQQFNILNDPEYEQMVQRVTKELLAYNSKQLKGDTAIRAAVAANAGVLLRDLANEGIEPKNEMP